MTELPGSVSRRGVLKVGATAGAFAIGGTALLSQSESAVAATFSISDADPETSDDGSLNYVRLQANHRVEWDGFDTDVEYIRYVDKVTVRPGDQNRTAVVNDTTSDHLDNWSGDGDSNGWGGDGEYTGGAGKAGYARADVDWNIIGDPNASDPAEGGPRSIESPADLLYLLEEDTDGETKQSQVVFEKQARLLDANQNEIDRSVVSDGFLVEVTNEEATTDAGGSGDASADGDNSEP